MTAAGVQMMREHPQAEFVCTACGADRSCQCNAPAIPKIERAKAAIAANPTKSDRAIAAEIGVSHETVRKARPTVNELTVEQENELADEWGRRDSDLYRTGLDGKTRRMPEPREIERDRAECIALYQKVLDAERERDRHRSETSGATTTAIVAAP
jgi:hypothetical protein